MEDKIKLKNELVATGRTPSCLGSNHVVGFDQFDLHAAASVTKSITGYKILCLFLRFPFFLSCKVQKNLLLVLFCSYHT